MFKRLIFNDDGLVRPQAAYTLIGLAVLILGIIAYRAWNSGERPMEGTWICWECGQTANITPSLDGELPTVCPHCGQKSLVPAYTCPRCKAPVALNEYRGMKPPTKCPKCGAEVWYGR